MPIQRIGAILADGRLEVTFCDLKLQLGSSLGNLFSVTTFERIATAAGMNPERAVGVGVAGRACEALRG